MLILGQKYTFTSLEEERLNKKFNHINFIKYSKSDPIAIIEELSLHMQEDKYKVIVLNTKARVPDEIIKYLTNLRFQKNIQIISIEKFLEVYLHKCYIPEDHTDLHFLEDIKPFNLWQYFQKRTIDYLASFTLLILSFPVLIISRRKIKQQSPGESLFKQLRVGHNNREFKCIKFRSMRLDAEKDGAQFATENDPRVFPFGETMRRTRIDEVPQIFNVIKGDMHFIGPRPERLFWIKEFEKEIPYYNERHLIKPGITGWAQVMYPYGANAEDAKQKLMYDLYYIKYWSIFLEIKIVWKTIMVVLGKKGI